MKLIDEYLDTLYKKDNNKSTLELKQEMRDHLIESVNDLKLQGLNDEEACKKAIEKFDDGIEMKQELHSIIKELSLSLDNHKSIIKGIRKIVCFISIFAFLTFGLMCYYSDILQKNRNELGKSFDEEIRILAQKYDMTKIDEYRQELESLLNEDKYRKIKAFRDVYKRQGLASSNMELITNALGLGTFFSGFSIVAAKDNKHILDFLGVNSSDELLSCLVIGYPDVKYKRTVPRKDAVINWM